LRSTWLALVLVGVGDKNPSGLTSGAITTHWSWKNPDCLGYNGQVAASDKRRAIHPHEYPQKQNAVFGTVTELDKH